MIVFYSLVLNHHQAPVADALWDLTKGDYRFVELSGSNAFRKGGDIDYSSRPYLIKAWKDKSSYTSAMDLAKTADVCVFGGMDALAFQTERLKLGLLSFEMGERWLKRGIWNLLSPRLLKFLFSYYSRGWRKKPLYKLCASAYAVNDQYKFNTYKGKCYKWGYFTEVPEIPTRFCNHNHSSHGISMMWCSRMIDWKHPELPVMLARKLKQAGYAFKIDIYGSGEEWESIRQMVDRFDLKEEVVLHGSVSNETVVKEMRSHDVFLFTSDRNEGWGAVANEAMANGCALVASDAIGCVPYLIEDGENGLVFHSNDVDSLYNKVKGVLNNKEMISLISSKGIETMQKEWAPYVAAERLINLATALRNEGDTPFKSGPCSKANPI